MAKRQVNSSNASALLAKKLAFHRARERYNSDISMLNKQLLQRCANTLTREQEFSGLEVVSCLMGWGDRFISHCFVTIYWSVVVALIQKQYPGMQFKRCVTWLWMLMFKSEAMQAHIRNEQCSTTSI